MSLISDALKKAERDRQAAAAPAAVRLTPAPSAPLPTAPPPPPPPAPTPATPAPGNPFVARILFKAAAFLVVLVILLGLGAALIYYGLMPYQKSSSDNTKFALATTTPAVPAHSALPASPLASSAPLSNPAPAAKPQLSPAPAIVAAVVP